MSELVFFTSYNTIASVEVYSDGVYVVDFNTYNNTNTKTHTTKEFSSFKEMDAYFDSQIKELPEQNKELTEDIPF